MKPLLIKLPGERLVFTFNWKLVLFYLLFMPLLVSLGFWQLERAAYKQQLQAEFEARNQAKPMSMVQLLSRDDFAFITVGLHGSYDNARSFLLDNRTNGGRAGFEVITPFVLAEPATANNPGSPVFNVVLVNRGWLPMGADRQQLPEIPVEQGLKHISAVVDIPLKQAIVLKDEPMAGGWPKVIQRFDVLRMASQLDQPVFAHTLRLKKGSAGEMIIIWKPIIMRPEKHMAYAVQWFALAATLTVLFLFATIKRSKETISE